MSKTKPDLYNDLHPTKSLKNTGFKNKETALRTIELVKKRSIRYQFDVINTMCNRAKYHPNKTKDMEDAIEIFSKWLKNYQKIKKKEEELYPWLSIGKINKFIELASEYKVGEVSRGVKPSTKTDKGFYQMYKEVNGKSYKLQYIPVKENKPNEQDYWSYRISFIKSRLGQMKKANTQLYVRQGKYKGLPTKQHLILILHGFSPDKNIYI
jgi:hypothetical protein